MSWCTIEQPHSLKPAAQESSVPSCTFLPAANVSLNLKWESEFALLETARVIRVRGGLSGLGEEEKTKRKGESMCHSSFQGFSFEFYIFYQPYGWLRAKQGHQRVVLTGADFFCTVITKHRLWRKASREAVGASKRSVYMFTLVTTLSLLPKGLSYYDHFSQSLCSTLRKKICYNFKLCSFRETRKQNCLSSRASGTAGFITIV